MNTTHPRLCRYLIGLAGLIVLLCTSSSVLAKVKLSVSAPILPRVLILYDYEGANFPSSLSDEQVLVAGASMTFEELLLACAPDYEGITTRGEDDPPLTDEQLKVNYGLVAQCSYDKFFVKPYWIPQLVNDVDICGQELGADWRLLTESDVLGFNDKEIEFLASTLTAVSDGTDDWWGAFYFFSLKVYIRGDDGTLKMGDLSVGAPLRIMPLPIPEYGSMTFHLEAGAGDPVVVRCINVKDVVDDH